MEQVRLSQKEFDGRFEDEAKQCIMTEDVALEFQTKINLLCDEYSVPRIELTMTEFPTQTNGVPFKMTYHQIEP